MCRVPRYGEDCKVLSFVAGGNLCQAVDALDRLIQRRRHIDISLLYRVLKRCIKQKDLVLGRRTHALVIQSGYEANTFLANHIICMYALHKLLEEALEVFERVPSPDSFMWASIILAHARHGRPVDAVKLYRKMQESNTKPDNHIFVGVLKACALAVDLASGRKVHADICRSENAPDVFVRNSLMDMYVKCGSLEDARSVFDSLPSKSLVASTAMITAYAKSGRLDEASKIFNTLSSRDVVTWNTMILGYAEHGLGQEALALYARMQLEGITSANRVTFVCVLQACASVGDLHHGTLVHSQLIQRGLESDMVLGTCLVDMYAKCGSLENACQVFHKLPLKDVVTWNAIISGHAYNGLSREALHLFAAMQQEGRTLPDAVTSLALMQACGNLAALEKGRDIHALATDLGLDAVTETIVASNLIDMYGKCGSMVEAQQVFDALLSKDIAAWNALIGGYARQGESQAVFDMICKMKQQGVHPDSITFLNVLTVCSHVGLLTEAQKHFQSMSTEYRLLPTIQHYTCMVDLMGRAGEVDQAMALVKEMPCQPDGVVWRTLLGACRKWNHLELGVKVFECAMKLDKHDNAAYVLMSNIYAAAGRHGDARQIQASRLRAQAWKKPGQSWWTDIHGVVHSFVAGDSEHRDMHKILEKVDNLVAKMKKAGYTPHLGSVLRDVHDDEKEAALCGHSEKLAIAHALLNTPEGTTIRVVKNLRVCEDCHIAISFISKIEQRTIICRDANRFHVYKDGKCSCKGYW